MTPFEEQQLMQMYVRQQVPGLNLAPPQGPPGIPAQRPPLAPGVQPAQVQQGFDPLIELQGSGVPNGSVFLNGKPYPVPFAGTATYRHNVPF